MTRARDNEMRTARSQRPAAPRPKAELPEEVLLRLQRTAGNRAVAEVLGRGRRAKPGSARPVVQRAVGFEFQTAWGIVRNVDEEEPTNFGRPRQERDPAKQADYPDVSVQHPVDRRGKTDRRQVVADDDDVFGVHGSPGDVREILSGEQYRTRAGDITTVPGRGRKHLKYAKGQVIKDYGAFRMTADDAATPLGAELEWVVYPPIEENAKPSAVRDVLVELTQECSRLVASFGERNSFRLSERTGARADQEVELQPGIKGDTGREMKANPQATGGVSIDALIDVFRDIADQRDTRVTGASDALSAIQGQPFAADMVAAADRMSGATLPGGGKRPASAALRGLMALVARYTAMGASQTPLAYAKVATQFLPRTDFAAIFGMLPDWELREYGSEKFGGAELNPVRFSMRARRALGGVNADRQVFVGGVKSGQGVIDLDITVGAWLEAMASGRDILSSPYWAAVSQTGRSSNLRQRGGIYSEQLEGMGSFGGKRDLVTGDVHAPTGVILEFRSNTAPLPYRRWLTYADAIYQYLKQANAARAQRS